MPESPVVPFTNRASFLFHACEDTEVRESNTVHVDVIDLDCFEVTKTTSCSTVFDGKNVTFCTRIRNTCPDQPTIPGILFRDILDSHFTYVPGTFTVNGNHRTPIYDDAVHSLEYTILDSDWNPERQIYICFEVTVHKHVS